MKRPLQEAEHRYNCLFRVRFIIKPVSILQYNTFCGSLFRFVQCMYHMRDKSSKYPLLQKDTKV